MINGSMETLLKEIMQELICKKEKMLYDYFKDKKFSPDDYEVVEERINYNTTKYSLRYKNSGTDLVYFIHSLPCITS